MSARTYRVAKAACVWVAFIVPAARATTWHVDDDNCPGPGSGTQADPFCSIQRGIDESVGGDEIVVAPGIYNETTNFNGKAITLRSSDGPDVTTIDATGLNNTVVRCVSGEGPDTLLQGFTITGGLSVTFGGGMRIDDSSPTVSDCVFRENKVEGFVPPVCGGAGMSILRGSPQVTNCHFIQNEANREFSQCAQFGGGMFIWDGAPTISDCTFVANNAHNGGGGIFTTASDAMMSSLEFVGNTVPSGAAMFPPGSGPALTNCLFMENVAVAGSGGGIYNHGSSSSTFGNCTFIANTADGGGGAIFNEHASDSIVTNSLFVGNVASSGGGIMNFSSSSSTFVNSVFSGNTAERSGGAIFTAGAASVMINCTLSGNLAANGGGAVYAVASGASITSCIFWGNSPDQVFDAENSVTINYSDVQGGWTGSGTNNIDAHPLFADFDGADNVVGSKDDNLRLFRGSPVIDAGDNGSVPLDTADLDGDGVTAERIPLDLDGNPRFADDTGTADTGNGEPPIVDMGAFEFQGRSTDMPTLSRWGMILTILALLTGLTVFIRRRDASIRRSRFSGGCPILAKQGWGMDGSRWPMCLRLCTAS